MVNGKKVSLDASPMIQNDTTLVPVKASAVIWGASYGWNEQTPVSYTHLDVYKRQVYYIAAAFEQ